MARLPIGQDSTETAASQRAPPGTAASRRPPPGTAASRRPPPGTAPSGRPPPGTAPSGRPPPGTAVNTNENKKSIKSREKNALVHGVYAKDVILPWESRRDFEKLWADLRAEFQPVGRMEEDSVFDLALLRLRKQRMQKMWTAAHYSDQFVSDLIESGQKSWSGILKHLKSKAEDTRLLAEFATGLFAEQLEETAKIIASTLKGEKISNSEVKKGEKVRTIFEQFTEPLIKALQDQPSAEESLRQIYSPEHLEPLIRLEAMIDARIDKTIARLISLKEYKRFTATCSPAPGPAQPSREVVCLTQR